MENILINNLEIMSQDLPEQMTWNNVFTQQIVLNGLGWRLPYEEEFKTIYDLYTLGIGNIKPERYWSYSSLGNKAWYYDISVGYSPHVINKSNLYYIRLVRNV